MSKNFSIIEEMVGIGERALSVKEISQIVANKHILDRYICLYPSELYSMILMSLTHRTYQEGEAKVLWENILLHRTNLNDVLNRDVGISVATIDYLANIKGILEEPKIIEHRKSKVVAKIATTDELTSLFVRDVFDVTLEREIERAKREDQVLSLAMIDIDDFKQVNDRFGHLVGDKVLAKVGDVISSVVRDMDLASRYGGEEIAVIMPNSDLQQAQKICQRIIVAIKDVHFDIALKVTVSIGLAKLNQAINSADDLIESADSALYKAKSKGKDQVVISENH